MKKEPENVEVIGIKEEIKLSDLLKKEDYRAIRLGFILLAAGMMIRDTFRFYLEEQKNKKPIITIVQKGGFLHVRSPPFVF